MQVYSIIRAEARIQANEGGAAGAVCCPDCRDQSNLGSRVWGCEVRCRLARDSTYSRGSFDMLSAIYQEGPVEEMWISGLSLLPASTALVTMAPEHWG